MGLVPTPAELLGAAAGIKQVVTGTVDQVAESASGALALVPVATTLLARASALLDRADALADHAQLVISRIDEVVSASDATVERVNVVTTKADRSMAGATGLVERTDALLGSVEPIARQALPIATRVVDSISPEEVDALVAMLDRMPALLGHLEDDVLPLLRQLDVVGPDVHAILETVQDLAERIEALPGMGLLRRRADKDDDA